MNIYFSGIGGVGIGPLAEISYDAGYSVSGSDLEESLITKELRSKGITVNIGQDGTFLKNSHKNKSIDWFVHTSALPPSHPELELAKTLGIKTAKRDELLAHIITEKNLKLIAIAGTHGKTTTTGMFIWTMKQLGIPISYSVGTTIKFGPSGKFDNKSEYFIYECDEFDKNFLHFNPFLSIIPSLDYDHPDTYPTRNSYNESFKRFVTQSDFTITWKNSSSEIFKDISNVEFVDENRIDNNIILAGIHNRKNATLVKLGIEKLKLDTDNIIDIISSFPGVDRRFEKLSENIYSDYGHHPVEIAATLQSAQELSNDIVLVYQPHQNIRQHNIKNEYTNQFEAANEIYWLPTYLSREDPELNVLKPIELINTITNKNQIHIANFNDELWNNIKNAQQNNKLVLIMGAGKIDSWVRQKLNS